jgi:hypothetical protein
MLKPITKKITDKSGNGLYSFTFYCDICDYPYYSAVYQSEPGQVTADTRETEYIAAYERANRDAIKNYNRCPVCNKIVCDDCFRLEDETDMCLFCFNM